MTPDTAPNGDQDRVTDSAATVERDPYACQVCNCHHHTTEQHDDPPSEPEWWHDY